jgi:hypothetical protein
MYGAHIGGTSIAAYSGAKAPAFRLLDDMSAAARTLSQPAMLAPDRREWFDLRGPRKWLGDSSPRIAGMLAAPPQHEWLEAVKYWNGGGRAPLWFVVDPARAGIDLVQHGDPVRYRWPVPYPVLLSGVRPNEMDWYRVDQPEWYVGEGWSLTPETAGVADADRRGPSLAPIAGWIDRRVLGGILMIGGRSLDTAAHPRLTVSVEGRPVWDEVLNPGPFLVGRRLPSDVAEAGNPRIYARLTVQAVGPGVAIEQFDASATRALSGFGAGWHEPEFDPRTGRRWRWLSERGEVIYEPNFRMSAVDVVDGRPLTLHLEGESSRKYFPRASLLTIRSGERRLLVTSIGEDFSIDVPVEGSGPLVLETDQVFLPADRGWRRSADRRHLGLRIFKAEIRKATR